MSDVGKVVRLSIDVMACRRFAGGYDIEVELERLMQEVVTKLNVITGDARPDVIVVSHAQIEALN